MFSYGCGEINKQTEILLTMLINSNASQYIATFKTHLSYISIYMVLYSTASH